MIFDNSFATRHLKWFSLTNGIEATNLNVNAVMLRLCLLRYYLYLAPSSRQNRRPTADDAAADDGSGPRRRSTQPYCKNYVFYYMVADLIFVLWLSLPRIRVFIYSITKLTFGGEVRKHLTGRNVLVLKCVSGGQGHITLATSNTYWTGLSEMSLLFHSMRIKCKSCSLYWNIFITNACK